MRENKFQREELYFKGDAMQVKRNAWTDAQIKALRKLYPHKRTADIVAEVGHSADTIYKKVAELGIRKTAAFMNSEASGHFVKGKQCGVKTQFKQGGTPWNKGIKGLQIGGEETRFKPGNKPINRKPVGTIVVRPDGYMQTKIAEPNVWELTHRLTWMQAGNEIPVHPNVLRFKDGNPLNCTDVDNLEVSTKAELMAANSVQALPEELRRIIQLRGVLTRTINGK